MNISGYYYRPRVDMDLLMRLDPKDVFVTTACIAGVWAYGYSSDKEIRKAFCPQHVYGVFRHVPKTAGTVYRLYDRGSPESEPALRTGL